MSGDTLVIARASPRASVIIARPSRVLVVGRDNNKRVESRGSTRVRHVLPARVQDSVLSRKVH